ncbi:hypothetical protein F5141DRAFT_1062723 [Pisolithus sp. B1]|nr:hypothetical protein F5141DRAFT_1062723 [Pisolithus sp. B1]
MEAEQATLEGSKVRPVRPKQGVIAVDVEANTHCHVDTDLAVCPSRIQRDKAPLSGGNHHMLTRQNAMRDVELTCALEQEKSHQQFIIDCLRMLLLTESTLHWLNLIWNHSTPNRKAFLLGHINNWANEVSLGASNNNCQNSAASNSQTSGKSYLPSSTVPSLMSKVTSVSSVTSDAAPAYRKTPMPVLNGSSGNENKDGMQDPTQALPVWIVGHHQPKMSRHTTSVNVNLQESNDDFNMPISTAAQMGTKHKCTGHHNSQVTSEVEEADSKGPDIDNSDTDVQLPKVPCVTTTTNIIASKSTKKPHTSQLDDTMVEGSGWLASAAMSQSQVSSIATNSTGTGCLCYTNGHLPPALQEQRKWTKWVLPALVTWAGSLGDLWVIPDQELMQVL